MADQNLPHTETNVVALQADNRVELPEDTPSLIKWLDHAISQGDTPLAVALSQANTAITERLAFWKNVLDEAPLAPRKRRGWSGMEPAGPAADVARERIASLQHLGEALDEALHDLFGIEEDSQC